MHRCVIHSIFRDRTRWILRDRTRPHSLTTLLVRVIALLEIKVFCFAWWENLIRAHVEGLHLRASAQITHTRTCAGLCSYRNLSSAHPKEILPPTVRF